MRAVGLDWTGLDWTGLEWNGLDRLQQLLAKQAQATAGPDRLCVFLWIRAPAARLLTTPPPPPPKSERQRIVEYAI